MLKENRVKSSELFDRETYRRQKRVDVKLRKKYTNLKFCGTSLARTLHQHPRTSIPTPYASTNHPRSEYRAFDRGFYRVIYKVL